MKIKLLFVCLLILDYAGAQSINEFGHYQREKEFVPAEIKEKIIRKHLQFHSQEDESNFIRIKNGYLFLPGDCFGSTSTLRIFNESGKELFNKTFASTINFQLSPNKSFCAFHDLMKIQVIDLVNLKSRSIEGSNVFSIDNSGNIAYFNKKEGSVNSLNQSSKVNEEIYKVFYFNGRPLFAGANTIYELRDNKLVSVFSVEKGRIFDVAQFDRSLFVCGRTATHEQFIFTSYKSDDLLSFSIVEEKYLPRQSFVDVNRKSGKKNANSRDTDVHDPIYFLSDTVYQPIGNSYGEMQFYGSPPYLHPGVDLLGNLAQDVHSVKKGYVRAILTTSGAQHWRAAISNENINTPSIGYLYAHLDELSIPYIVGDSVEEGDVIGQLVDFGVPGFNHCHFARITDSAWFGAWWTLDNPLSFMSNVFDTTPPVFEKTINNDEFAFRDINGNYLSPDSLYGGVRIISKFHDIVNSIWKVDVNKIRFSLSPLSAPQVLLLDTISLEYNFYTDVYATSTYTTNVLNTIYSTDSVLFSSGNYNERDFYHIISSSDGNDTIDGNDSLQLFNTMNYFDGDYILRVVASDADENTSTDSMIIRFRNNIDDIRNPQSDLGITVSPNPSSNGKFILTMPTLNNPMRFDVYNELGKRIKTGLLTNIITEIDIREIGFYTLRVYDGKKTICKKLARF